MFREALGKVRNKGEVKGEGRVCGVLLRKGVGSEWLSRVVALSCRLADHCNNNG